MGLGPGAAWKPKHGKACVISQNVSVIVIRLQNIDRNVQKKVVDHSVISCLQAMQAKSTKTC